MSDNSFDQTSQRSCMVGHLDVAAVGRSLRLVGWVHRRRDLGGLLFVDLRDRSGLLQVSLGPDWTEAADLEVARGLGHEDVVYVEGEIALRPEGALNPEMPTGAVELRARRFAILTDSDTPAIPVYRTPEEALPSEELRLRHRVLDLRRPELQENLHLRHRLILRTRNYMDSRGFTEVETPLLTKPTPEGARDFLVPSRVHKGEFYALPQSPQIYKQLLMAAGFDRYFQIARCFRDEDLRADRQPEFTQIDVEASFVEPEDIFAWIEGLMAGLAEEAPGIEAAIPFPRMTHAEAMELYGIDRPDLRFGLTIGDWTSAFANVEFGIVRGAVEAGGRVRGLRISEGARLSRRQIEAIEAQAKAVGAPGLLWVKRSEEGGSGPLSKFLTSEHYAALGMEVGDLALAAAGDDRITSPALAAARSGVIEAMGFEPLMAHSWLWVTDFPVFEEFDDGSLGANHHPFVLPHPDDAALLDTDPLAVRGQAYDLVYNGVELGSGSIRIHEPGLQRKILGILGLSEEDIDFKFGFLLSALASGAPPHGGVALGIDRIVRLFTGASSLRDVIAFPKTTAARALFEGAPSRLAPSDLAELGIEVVAPPAPAAE